MPPYLFWGLWICTLDAMNLMRMHPANLDVEIERMDRLDQFHKRERIPDDLRVQDDLQSGVRGQRD